MAVVLSGRIYLSPRKRKSPEVINKQCRALCENTGYDEVSLSSLSSSDYTQIVPLLTKLNEWSKDEKSVFLCRHCELTVLPTIL